MNIKKTVTIEMTAAEWGAYTASAKRDERERMEEVAKMLNKEAARLFRLRPAITREFAEGQLSKIRELFADYGFADTEGNDAQAALLDALFAD